jgi:hypothetical protein
VQTIYIFLLIIIFSVSASGQKALNYSGKSGIYRTYEDFTAKKLTYETDNAKEPYSIKVDDYLTRPYVDVIYKGKKYSFLKKDIYGVSEGEERNFRFFNNKEYLIVDTGKVYIYKLNNPASDKSLTYFYSLKGNSKVMPLTLANLKNSYPENPRFRDLIDLYFKTDADLTAFDNYYKTYKLNRFLFKHLK